MLVVGRIGESVGLATMTKKRICIKKFLDNGTFRNGQFLLFFDQNRWVKIYLIYINTHWNMSVELYSKIFKFPLKIRACIIVPNE